MTLEEKIKIQDAEDRIAQEIASAELERRLESNAVINITKSLKEIKETVPDTGDKEAHDRLIIMVDEATQNNEHLAKVVENAQKIGGKIFELAKKYFT